MDDLTGTRASTVLYAPAVIRHDPLPGAPATGNVLPGGADDIQAGANTIIVPDRSDFLARYSVRQVGGSTILELWIPAEDLDDLSANIVGQIEVIHEFTKDSQSRTPGPGTDPS